MQVLEKPAKTTRVDHTHRKIALITCVIGLGSTCMANSAFAQFLPAQDDSIQSVRTRPRPDFNPTPIRVGAFNVSPSVEARIAYDDNVYAATTNEIDDALISLNAAISVQTNWSRHAASLSANTALSKGLSQDNEDTHTHSIQASGQLDIGPSTRASLSAAFGKAYEPRGSVGDTSTVNSKRISYETTEIAGELSHNFGRLALEASASLENYSYNTLDVAGTNIVFSDRDYRSWVAGLRAAYAVSTGIGFYVEGNYNEASYPDETAQFDRSSNGYSLRGGVQFGVTRLIRGKAGLGYQNQSYGDPAYPRIKGLDFLANLEWSPTELISVSFDAKRTIQRSPIVGVAGIRQSLYGGRIDYEFRRNVILYSRLQHMVSEFSGIDRTQNDFLGELGANWLLTRNIHISTQATFQKTNSSGLGGREFDRKRFTVALRYRL